MVRRTQMWQCLRKVSGNFEWHVWVTGNIRPAKSPDINRLVKCAECFSRRRSRTGSIMFADDPNDGNTVHARSFHCLLHFGKAIGRAFDE